MRRKLETVACDDAVQRLLQDLSKHLQDSAEIIQLLSLKTAAMLEEEIESRPVKFRTGALSAPPRLAYSIKEGRLSIVKQGSRTLIPAAELTRCLSFSEVRRGERRNA